jgi:hypothetical protein
MCDAPHLRREALIIHVVQITRRGVTVMVRGLWVAILGAIFLSSFAFPRGAIAWTPLNYEEAAWMCSIGNLQACEFMYAYEMNRYRVPGGGLLADPWLSPGDPQSGTTTGASHGPPSGR